MKKIVTIGYLIGCSINAVAQVATEKVIIAKEIERETRDTLASYPGGEAAFDEFIKKHLQTSPLAKRNNVSGDVVVKFVINEKGLAGEFDIVQKLGYGCDEEALRVLSMVPQWQAGVINGTRIKSTLRKKFHFDPSLPVSETAPGVTVVSRNIIPDAPSMFGDNPEDLSAYVSKNYKHPASAAKNIEGNIVLRLKILSSGKPSDIKLVAGIDEQIDQVVVELIRNMPAWHPRTKQFTPVDTYQDIVVNIKKRKASLLSF
jgi:hypothetical protein